MTSQHLSLLQLFYVENNFHFYRLIVFCDQNNSV